MPDTVYGRGDGWWSKVLLTLVNAPPPALIEAPAARFVTVSEPQSARPPRDSHYGLIIAWAAIDRRTSSWACLLVWDGWRNDETGHPRPGARWSWVRWDPDRINYHKPWQDHPNGLRFFGRHRGEHMEQAWFEAVESLPLEMRQAALQQAPYEGPPAA